MHEPPLLCRVIVWALCWALFLGGAARGQISIRTNNPGAMWPGPIATRYGSTTSISGLPGGNKIAVFPDPVQGAAAHFALLAERYAGLTLRAAVHRWSGGDSGGYVRTVAELSGVGPDEVVTAELLASDRGLVLVKAMARWEAGREFPLSNAQWRAARAIALQQQFVEKSTAESPAWDDRTDPWMRPRDYRPLLAP